MVRGCEVEKTALVPLPTIISVNLSVQTILAIERLNSSSGSSETDCRASFGVLEKSSGAG